MRLENIAYCGLYCGDCPFHKGVIADLARDLRKELRDHHFEKTAELLSKSPFFKEFKKYNDCYTILGTMVKLRCNKTCRNGGGNPLCKIKNCVIKKKLSGCWECKEFESCKKLNFLNTNHGVAHMKNLRLIKKKGVAEFEKGEKHWYKTK